MLFSFFRREPTEEEMWGPHAALFKPIEPPQTPSPPGSPPSTLRSKLLEVSSHRELTVVQYKDLPRRTLLAAFSAERSRRRELEHALKKVTAERDALSLERDRLLFEVQRQERCQCRLRPVRTESTDVVVHWAPPSSRAAAVALCTTAPNLSHFSLQDTLAIVTLQQQQHILASPYQPLSESPSTCSIESSSTRGVSTRRHDSGSDTSTALVLSLTKAKAKAVNIPSKIPRRATPSPPTLRARPRQSPALQLEFKDVVERAALARVRTSDAGSLVPRPCTGDDSSASLPSLTMSSTVPSIGSFASSSLPEGSLPTQLDPSCLRAEDGMATPKAGRPGFYFEESPRL
ncbi:hypothetical protein AURDEDRAFT_111837 [Auricularia subglabra TFB-10046 SS5]|nr:hypothetical protein AURDEDRAFT_111837 [Auricularia subglabra TFB-10046 SS5]